MTLTELERLVESQAPGGLLPRDWMLEQIRAVAHPESAMGLADLSVDGAGEVLGRSPSTVRAYCRRGLLPGCYRQQGREWRIPVSAIRSFQRGTAGSRPKRSHTGEADLSAWREVA